MFTNKEETYNFDKSPFYKLNSPKLLCKILGYDLESVKKIIEEKKKPVNKWERNQKIEDKKYYEIECKKNELIIVSTRKTRKR